MKKIFILLLTITPSFAMAQNFIKVPIDSVKSIVQQVELFSNTKLHLRERADSLEDYLFRDDTRFITVKVNMKNEKKMDGLKVVPTSNVDYIVISGPTQIMESFFTKYLKTSPGILDAYGDQIKTKKWDAKMDDQRITNKDLVDMQGKAIWITEHSDL